jgi:signal transduction histidine kinase
VGTPAPLSLSTVADSRLVLINIPLLQDNTVVGSLSLVLSPNRSLSDNDRKNLGQIAQGLGQIASLVTELEQAQHRLNQLSIFYQVGQALVTTFDINRLLSDTMQLAANVIDAGASSIMLIDENQKELVFEVSHGAGSQMLRQQRIPLDEGIAGWVARHGQPVISNQARTDPRFSHRVDVRTGFLTQSIAAVPLRIKGRIIGVLEVLNKYSGNGFSQEDVQLMSSIAAQAAIAIENARLYQQVRQERDQIIRAQENVRREMARNLHDGPVQLLAAISISLDHLERLNQVQPAAVRNEIEALRNLVHKATRDTRNVLFELRPIILETQGLVAALDQYVTFLQNAESFTVHFEFVEDIDLNIQAASTIFSIIQEAINNIKRHAEARNVWLSLEMRKYHFIVTIRDDGLGFKVDEVIGHYDQHSSLGLLNMRERAELIDAELRIESHIEQPNRGSMVQIILPLSLADATAKEETK